SPLHCEPKIAMTLAFDSRGGLRLCSRAMSVQVKIPAVGESISSGVVSVWHKKSGEQVKKGDPLFTLETDKVSTEIVAEAYGVLKTKAAEGQEVKIGEVVAEIEMNRTDAEAHTMM